jgi:hypothetical protein
VSFRQYGGFAEELPVDETMPTFEQAPLILAAVGAALLGVRRQAACARTGTGAAHRHGHHCFFPGGEGVCGSSVIGGEEVGTGLGADAGFGLAVDSGSGPFGTGSFLTVGSTSGVAQQARDAVVGCPGRGRR